MAVKKQEKMVQVACVIPASLRAQFRQHAMRSPSKSISGCLTKLMADACDWDPNKAVPYPDKPKPRKSTDELVEAQDFSSPTRTNPDLAAYVDRQWEEVETIAISSWMMRHRLDTVWDLKLEGGVEKRNISLVMVESELIQLNYKGKFQARKVTD